MYFRDVFNTISTFFLLGFGLMSDSVLTMSFSDNLFPSLFDQTVSLWDSEGFSTDEFVLTELPFSSSSLVFNQPDSFWDEGLSSGDPGFYPLENYDTDFSPLWEDDFLDDSLELVDCSTSDYLPSIGRKSRVKRIDDPAMCKSSMIEPLTGSADDENAADIANFVENLKIPQNLEGLWLALGKPEHNLSCFYYTSGLLPWGVCSSSQVENVRYHAVDPAYSISDYRVATLYEGTPGTKQIHPAVRVSMSSFE
jgi:hypothetical protein